MKAVAAIDGLQELAAQQQGQRLVQLAGAALRQAVAAGKGALALASRCYVLDQGRVQFEGTAAALADDHAIQTRYLGVA